MLIILIVYFVFFVLWVIGSGIAIYHNIEYYEPKTKMRMAIYGYFWVSTLILLFSFYILYKIDWSVPINLSS
ncbi:MAG: hypothetical protein AAB632_00555 [Patescibacteria group bacterium]